nr:hypothetical protein HmN_000872900 [Hymenolepis microstoma]
MPPYTRQENVTQTQEDYESALIDFEVCLALEMPRMHKGSSKLISSQTPSQMWLEIVSSGVRPIEVYDPPRAFESISQLDLAMIKEFRRICW